MNRSLGILLCLGLGLVASPALAQQPPTLGDPQQGYQYPSNGSQYGAQPVQPQYDPSQQQTMDPYANYDSDDEDDGYDVSYDVSTSEAQQPYDDGYDPNAYQQFESQLSPYGAWQDVPSYGHVWVPSTTVVGVDFSPYSSGGHFVMSDYGWTWVSDWDWGWAPFHYGRWIVAGGYGWCWIPGTNWGPAWVDWRWGGGYVGWAPLGPRGVVIGPPRGIRSPWRFTVAGQLGSSRPAYLPSRAVASVWGRTAAINNVSRASIGGATVSFNAGPSAHLVAQTVGHPVTSVALNSIAPHALPRATIVPRAGVPIASRPWVQSRTIGGAFAHPAPGARTLGNPAGRPSPAMTPQPLRTQPFHGYNTPAQQQPYRYAQPAQQPYHYAQPAQQPYHYAQPAQQPYHYAQPAPQYHYSAPAQSYHPSYSAPAPQYHYSAPAQSYHPSYSAPAQSYHPSYSAPAATQHYSAPAATFHGGGGWGGGAARGGFHR